MGGADLSCQAVANVAGQGLARRAKVVLIKRAAKGSRGASVREADTQDMRAGMGDDARPMRNFACAKGRSP